MAKIAIFASGNGSNFDVLAQAFNDDADNTVEVMICNKKKAYVFERADRLNVSTEYVPYGKGGAEKAEERILEILKEREIDVIFLAGFMKILSSEFIEKTGVPIINIHPSILPKYKGVHSIERAFKSDDTEIGISIHYVVEEVDSGEIIIQKTIPLEREKGLDYVEEQVHKLEHTWFPVVAKQICDTINNK